MSKAAAPTIQYTSKIVKEGPPTEIEEKVAKALVEIETAGGSDIKAEVKEFVISGAKQMETSKGKVALVVFYPFRCHAGLRKIQAKLIREMEKKMEKCFVMFVANRTILNKNFRRKGLMKIRPRTRTLTSVHEQILEDIVAPTEIVGKRTRCCVDGSKLHKILLNPKEKDTTEEKLGAFTVVYKTLTNKETNFSYPAF